MKLVFHFLQKKFVHLVLFGKTAKKKTVQNTIKDGVFNGDTRLVSLVIDCRYMNYA